MQILEKLDHLISQAENQDITLNLEETIDALRTLQRISQHWQLLEKIVPLLVQTEETFALIDTLSKRESEVFRWIGLGCSSREIGRLMDITESTVSTHRKKIVKKLGLSGPGKLQRLALEMTIGLKF